VAVGSTTGAGALVSTANVAAVIGALASSGVRKTEKASAARAISANAPTTIAMFFVTYLISVLVEYRFDDKRFDCVCQFKSYQCPVFLTDT
jgi:hypothetical protein